MIDKKIKFYAFGRVHHQDDTNPIELIAEADTEESISTCISQQMNLNFPPQNIFVIRGQRLEVSVKSVLLS